MPDSGGSCEGPRRGTFREETEGHKACLEKLVEEEESEGTHRHQAGVLHVTHMSPPNFTRVCMGKNYTFVIGNSPYIIYYYSSPKSFRVLSS